MVVSSGGGQLSVAVDPIPSPAAGDGWVAEAVEAVEASITRLLNEFVTDPFIHRVEHSLHVRLVQLFGEWEHLRGLYPIGASGFRTQLIHKEWPEARPRRRKGTEDTRRRGNIDLAVLAPAQLAQASLDQFIDGRISAPIVIELGLNYTDKHLNQDLDKLENSQVSHAYLVHLSRVQSAHHGAAETAIGHATTRTQHTGIKLAYARRDLVRGRVFVKHLNDMAITSPGQALAAAEGDDQESSRQPLEVPAGNARERILISVTQGGLDNNYVSLAGNLGFFPQDSLGPSNLRDGEGTMLTLHFAGLDGTHLTDIASNYPGFRRRGPWSRFFAHHQIAAGDVVAIQRLSPYEYRVLPLIQPGQER